MTTSEATTRNDLAWLANCYVAGELSADEAAAFEARMESDVAACDAVARAMELNLAIAAAFETVPSSLSPRALPVTQSSRTIGAAIAATAVAAASVALMIGHSVSPNGVARKDGADRIVAAWASGEAARNIADDDDSPELASDDDLDPPDWMLAALTAEDLKDQPGKEEIREN